MQWRRETGKGSLIAGSSFINLHRAMLASHNPRSINSGQGEACEETAMTTSSDSTGLERKVTRDDLIILPDEGREVLVWRG